MGKRVDLDRHALLQPSLQMGFGGGDRIAKNAQRRAAVDFLEAFEDRAAVALVPAVLAHVVDSQRDHGLHAFLTHPLWRGELREIEAHVERVFAIEIGQSVGGGLGQSRSGGCQKNGQQTKRLAKLSGAKRQSIHENTPTMPLAKRRGKFGGKQIRKKNPKEI